VAVRNGSFEDVGGLPGQAAGWDVQQEGSVEESLTFGPYPRAHVERFDRGFGNDFYLLAYTADRLVLGTFDGHSADPAEDYEEGWGNTTFVWTFYGAPADFSQGDVEDYEADWDNVPWIDDWGAVSASAAVYDGTAHAYEGFQQGWSENETFVSNWSAVGEQIAHFDGSVPEDYEDFDEVPTEATFTASVVSQSCHATGHGLVADDVARVRNLGGHLPGPLEAGVDYYALPLGPDDFQLALTSGGGAITLTSVGVGTHKVRKIDPTIWWVDVMVTL